MKKVALVAYNLNPNGISEAVVAALWLKIIAKHYSVEVFTDKRHERGNHALDLDNVKFHYIGNAQFWRNLENKFGMKGIGLASSAFFRGAKKALINVGDDKISFIHCITPFGIHSYNDIYTLGIPVLIGPLGGGLPTPKGFFYAFRYQILSNYARDWLYKILIRRPGWTKYLQHSKRIIIGTNYLKEVIPRELHQQCVTIYDSVVDTDYWRPAEHNNPLVRILFVGRLVSQKGPVLLIEAVKKCVAHGLNGFVVEIVGEGVLRKDLENLIKKYDLRNIVQLLGRMEREHLLKKYQETDVFCLPTLRDPGGNAILEAMSCGLPVITSDYGGPRDVVTDSSGIKIELRGFDSYANDLAVALENLVSRPELRETMAVEARRLVKEKFSEKALIEKITKLYEECLTEDSQFT